MPLSNRVSTSISSLGTGQSDGIHSSVKHSVGQSLSSSSIEGQRNYKIHHDARISLVGAGPGDPELITLKALNALKGADVILYDSLANPALLDHNPNAKRVFVGKRKGWQRYSQEEINDLLLYFAQHPWHIVRLKGGDPMIFGRAMEELITARKYGIPIKVVPGVSAYSGMSAQLQVPLTERGISKSFWVVTGTNKKGQLTKDIALAAQSTANVVVYMGISQLERIVSLFALHQPPDYPIGIVQNATSTNVRTLSGQLDNILTLQAIAQLGSPGLIVLGPAAQHLDELAHKMVHNEWGSR
ncbi:MAG: uroporphyrinogen-III C-methyltransferase [Bacteroidota bacterium]